MPDGFKLINATCRNCRFTVNNKLSYHNDLVDRIYPLKEDILTNLRVGHKRYNERNRSSPTILQCKEAHFQVDYIQTFESR